MTFQQHCESLGIQLLKDDIKFIKQKLNKIQQSHQKQHLTNYANIWAEAMNKETIPHKRQNAGRFNANKYLLELG